MPIKDKKIKSEDNYVLNTGALVYLDWNVLNKIEQAAKGSEEDLTDFLTIERSILSGQIITPYSNAHMSDLYRGYLKNRDYIDGHLATIERLSHHLCLTQYWNESKARWHYRDVHSYFEDMQEEAAVMPDEFEDLFVAMDPDPLDHVMVSLHRSRCTLMSMQPVPANFKDIYKEDPIFHTLFPRTKTAMNMLALTQDLYAMHSRFSNDFTLYKNFRKYLVQARQKYPQLPRPSKMGGSDFAANPPAYLTWDEAFEVCTPSKQPSANANYDRVMDRFTKTDIKGYRPDERFANLIDDAMHTFYGAHCAYFVTMDGRCYDKAIKVYNELKITTKVLKPSEFVKEIKQLDKNSLL